MPTETPSSPPAPPPRHSLRFGGVDEILGRYDHSPIAIWPVPLERTVSYGRGTAHGPAAILEASQNLELYDEELHCEPCSVGIATLPPFEPAALDMAEAIHQIQRAAKPHLEIGKCLVALGGEHSLTTGPVRAVREVYPELGVVQFDAHADLRDEYEGSPYNHACVMRRIHDDGLPTLSVGIRSLSEPEGQLIQAEGFSIIWGAELASLTVKRFGKALELLPETVYLTFDVDYFDPALIPATGTPEPGGGKWWSTLALLRELFRRKRVVAMDVVELAPIVGQTVSDFIAARLVYKLCAYWAEAAGLLTAR